MKSESSFLDYHLSVYPSLIKMDSGAFFFFSPPRLLILADVKCVVAYHQV